MHRKKWKPEFLREIRDRRNSPNPNLIQLRHCPDPVFDEDRKIRALSIWPERCVDEKVHGMRRSRIEDRGSIFYLRSSTFDLRSSIFYLRSSPFHKSLLPHLEHQNRP